MLDRTAAEEKDALRAAAVRAARSRGPICTGGQARQAVVEENKLKAYTIDS